MAHSLSLCAKTSKYFVACTGLFAGEPAPTGVETCRSGFTREEASTGLPDYSSTQSNFTSVATSSS